MVKNFRDKVAISGITVLMIGIALLVFTFISAYGLLTQALSIISSQDLVQTFGDALAPLISTSIRIMYLGVMGWVGSLITIRGVTLIAHVPQVPTAIPQKEPVSEQKQQPQPQPQPQKAKVMEKPKVEKPKEEKPKEEKPRGEIKLPEPEIIVIPPEQVSQPEPKPPEKEQEQNTPPPQSSSN
jgi:cytoskeletal protein RodZ